MNAALCLKLLLQKSLPKPYCFAGFPMPSVLKELEGFNTLMAGNTLDSDRHQQSDNLDIQGLLRETIQIMDQFLWSVHHFSFADFFQIPPTYGAAVQIRNQSIHGEGWSAGRCPLRFMAASCSQLSFFAEVPQKKWQEVMAINADHLFVPQLRVLDVSPVVVKTARGGCSNI